MSNHKARLSKLEKKANPPQIVYDVQEVDEITDDMRREQREAHARGEKYYIVEPQEDNEYE